jgi:hypothetical protein
VSSGVGLGPGGLPREAAPSPNIHLAHSKAEGRDLPPQGLSAHPQRTFTDLRIDDYASPLPLSMWPKDSEVIPMSHSTYIRKTFSG